MTPEYLSRPVYLRIRQQLADGLSAEDIVQETGLSAEMVAGIEAGQITPSRIVVDEDDPDREEVLQARRCPGCGGLIYRWPCLACQLEAGETPKALPRVRGVRLKEKQRRHARRRAA